MHIAFQIQINTKIKFISGITKSLLAFTIAHKHYRCTKCAHLPIWLIVLRISVTLNTCSIIDLYFHMQLNWAKRTTKQCNRCHWDDFYFLFVFIRQVTFQFAPRLSDYIIIHNHSLLMCTRFFLSFSRHCAVMPILK